MKKTLIQLLFLIFLFPCGVVCSIVNAQETVPVPTSQKQPGGKPAAHSTYTRKGADTCAMCHDEDSTLPVLPIEMTKHAQPADTRTPFAGLQCESCHGPGAAHAKWVQPGEKQAPIITFGTDSQLTAKQQNDICLDCHRGGQRIAWHNSLHDDNNVTCTRCHRIHVARDPVLETRTQPTVCYQCHKKTRSDFLKPSKHPVRFAKMTCSDCHQVHGGNSSAALVQPTLNQTCFTCHAEKRGPLLWEHAPVTEDCSICHDAHGSVQPALLKKRAPLLCQQCHSQFGHPSVARSAGGLPGATPSTFLLVRSCMNCHSHIHGSNHPSGAMFMR
ncbi:MAG: DmsE family decaheme c-type cytochrome [Gammaproteobacteria bacterium]|jgi:DmsE family decaheme c-type cytochrome